jgi:hypothetical protein
MAALALSVLSIAVAARAQDVSPLPVGFGPATLAPSAPAPAPPPQPFTLREQEIFLETGRVSKVRGVKAGITGTRRATLVAGNVLHDVSVQTVDESLARFESARRVEFNFRDYWGYNVAAYRLGVLLGLDNIPPSVARRFDARPAAFTWWVDDVLMDERARTKAQVTPPDRTAWTAQIHVMRLFDQLIANTDRNQTNMLIDHSWKLWLIDHSRAFRVNDSLLAPEVIRRCERSVFARLKALTPASLEAELGDYLTSIERKALLKRRDRIVERIEALGPAALFDAYR